MRRSAEHREPAAYDPAGTAGAVDLPEGEPVRGLAIAPVRPHTRDPRVTALLGLAATLLVVAVLKPWGVAAPAATRAPRPVVVASIAPTPVPTRDRSADGLASPICLGAGAWRIASLERWRTEDVRVWRAIEPAPVADGPLDVRIPSVPIVAVELIALGWCAPAYGESKPVGPVRVTAWVVRAGAASALPLDQVQPPDGTTPLAALYVPRAGPARSGAPTTPGVWTSGRVVFRYLDDHTGNVAWLAADIAILPAPAGLRP
jgi:hypothetical protein